MRNIKPLRACPVCRNKAEAEVLHTQKFALPDKHPLPARYDVVACVRCGFVYADTPAGQGAYDRYYEGMSNYDMGHGRIETSLYVERARWIKTFIGDKKAGIIDVGCGKGQLLRELRKLGFSNLTALDPSRKCIDAVRSRGIKGIVSSIFDVLPGKQYDHVILSGVLEHICDVPRIMRAVKKLMKKNGSLFVCVPDASRYKDYDLVPFDYFNIEHINHFDEVSLIDLGLAHGLSAVSFLKTVITLDKSKQPVIFCVYKNGGSAAAGRLNYSKNSVKEYIAVTKINKNADRVIAKLIESGEEIIVWGAGNYTSRLLASSALGKCNIVMFVDNDKHKQGTAVCGKPVRAPEAISCARNKPAILVAAAVFHDEIIAQIKKMGIDNKVVVLR